jgi:hypothetical protein
MQEVDVTRRYFQQVGKLDYEAVEGDVFDPTKIMALWDPDGVLTITGPQPIGTRTFKKHKQIEQFYRNRAKGKIADTLSEMVWNLNSVEADGEGKAVVTGDRYLVNMAGEGTKVPFRHNFEFGEDSLITNLRIKIGRPVATKIITKGSLTVTDMGQLASVAWMVA